MGKFTDDFFSFPIKVYDGFSLKKAMEEEEKETADGPVPIDWVMGWVKIPAKDLYKLMWHDGFSRERNVKDVADEGFDLTIVMSDIYGEFVCTWGRKKFETKLDEFMEKWEQSKPHNDLSFLTLTAIPSPKGAEKKDD
jgi:hypothetical protein